MLKNVTYSSLAFLQKLPY